MRSLPQPGAAWRIRCGAIALAAAACVALVAAAACAGKRGTEGAPATAPAATDGHAPAPAAAQRAPSDGAPTAASSNGRFFVAGDGTLVVQSVHFGDRATLRYRRADGSYDREALDRLARVLRSRDGRVGTVSLRFVELLARVQAMTGGAPLRVLSGYRSPGYNEGLRARGRKAASGSLHTEGMAADLAIGGERLEPLWHELRALECCGAGLYAAQGFMHVDVGPPRFWEAHTSRVDENLSGGNARLFASTEFDRYERGDVVVVSLHALTAPPVRIATTARVVDDPAGAPRGQATVEGSAPGADGDADRVHPDASGCIEVDARTRMRVSGAPAVARGRIVLATCEPRPERTPAEVVSNPIEVR